MNLKTKLIVTFAVVIAVPLFLISIVFVGFMSLQPAEVVTPQTKEFLGEMLISVILIMAMTCSFLMAWIYRSILSPIETLKKATQNIRDGNLDFEVEIEDNDEIGELCADFEEMRLRLKESTEEKVSFDSQNKELISNISHDLKTPLTAIITYVDLLKKEDLTDEERREYVDTLEKKSNRLKVLIEDLFEVSKATTDNLVMNYAEVDLVNLIKEVRLENEDKITSSSLDFRWNLPEEKCILRLDPQRTFRVIDNLVQNILKYSMPNSRVYIALQDQTTQVTVSFKNMSAVEMNFTPEEITERFARGDLSRNTEGSGLGLAIAQSFTELQGGEFKVETDADLFKVTITWKRQPQTKENTEN